MEPRFATKSEQHTNEKRQIALAAAKLVRPQDSLALSGGTTTLAVARALTELEHFPTLTIITNSLPAANLLFDAADTAREQGHPAPTVILSGGERTPSAALVGLTGIDALGLQCFCSLDDLDVLITDRSPEPQTVAHLEDHGITLTIAD